jgi:methanogenic corrinoid protein MtbC1
MDSSDRPNAEQGERLYSVQEAARLLDLKPATLRAWERRHGLPRPRRGANGYRLYTQADLEVLRRLKARTESGTRIGLAVEEGSSAVGGRRSGVEPLALDSLRERLVEAILHADVRQAAGVMREALVAHPVEEVLVSLIEPVLIWIGDEWQAGHLAVGVEHYASSFFVRQLVLLDAASPYSWRPGVALAASLPGDRHEIGLLMISVCLRRRGWDVRYFGADLPALDLERAAARLRPEAVLLSGTMTADEEMLTKIVARLRGLPAPAPHLILGGQAFRGHSANSDGVTRLDGGLHDVLSPLETTLLGRTRARSIR